MKSYQNHFSLNKPIVINNVPIKQLELTKLLGVTIDQHLNWKEQIHCACSKLRESTGLIYIASSFLPQKILIKLHYALIHSQIPYWIESWGNVLLTNLNPLICTQHRVIRTICKKESGSEVLYKKLNILTLKNLYLFRLTETAFTLFNNSPKVLHYDTRHSLWSLPLPPSTTQAGHRRVEFQVAACWNQLPVELRKIKNWSSFKKYLKEHLISQ